MSQNYMVGMLFEAASIPKQFTTTKNSVAGVVCWGQGGRAFSTRDKGRRRNDGGLR